MWPHHLNSAPGFWMIVQIREFFPIVSFRRSTNDIDVPSLFQQPKKLADNKAFGQLGKAGHNKHQSLAHDSSRMNFTALWWKFAKTDCAAKAWSIFVYAFLPRRSQTTVL